ncbi:zinc finger and SCAN domain-containing protein 2 [Tachysurus fulvidraco]|uniref:zinc finger and SCAN domain-containing protein 2 n=1 Tax=Tachysurus fulvidraco TaxID=1234273 RepID=UPI001FED7CE7|nr:zinc finger and SCAN domain-containing protein 2 [Tachysurus fulvidraco]
MSSELTIDIQLTELGFSSWDFQVLKQKDTPQTSDLEYASLSSSSSSSSLTAPPPATACPMPVEILVDEEPDEEPEAAHLAPGVSSQSVPHIPKHDASFVHVDSTETRTGESSKTVCGTNEKRRKRLWFDENTDEQVEEDKKKKTHTHQVENEKKRDRGAQRMLVSASDVSEEEEEENQEEEDDDEDDYEEEDDEDENNLTDEEECDDDLSSDANSSEEHLCEVCSLTFPTSFLLREHMRVHNGVRLYRCAECGKQFCHLVNYRKHLRAHAKASVIQCVVCTAQFATQEDLQQHLDTNHFEEKFYQCDLCKRIFTSMAECKTHVHTHQRRVKRYPCPKCEHTFLHHSSMLYHLKRHNKGVFLCTDCGLAFSTKGVLLRHSFHHLGLLPYTCIRCKRHFRLASLYLKHECKPEQLQCVACLVTFQSQEDFLKHKKDTGCWGHQTALSAKTNDIRCMECGQVFDNSEELKKHAGTHQRVMRCSECGMGFRSSIMLMSHMGGHVAQRPCLCKECGLGFCHQQAYDSHLKTCGLVNAAEIALKKQKPNSTKKDVVAIAKNKEVQILPKHAPSHPPNVVSSQPNPADSLTTVSVNKKPLSSVPLFMLLPVPSTSASNSIPNPAKLTSDVSKKSVSAPPVIHIPLQSNNGSVHKESIKTAVVKDLTSLRPASNILISMKNTKTGWSLLQGPSTPGPVTKIYVVREESKQATAANSISEQKTRVLSNLEILQILNILKKTGDKKKETLSSSESTEMTADDGTQKGSSLETSNTSLKQSSDCELTTKTGRDILYTKPQGPDFDSSAVTCDSLPLKTQPEEDQIPKASTELSSENRGQNTDNNADEENSDLDNAATELGDESDVVQCETCGKMILDKDLVQHTMKHSVSNVLTTS